MLKQFAGKLELHRTWLRCLPHVTGFLILLVTLCLLTPFWLSNDDVGLAMVAHGYGIAAAPAKTLIFPNLAWGYLISWLPNFLDIQSYTWATYLALAISYVVLLYSLIRNKANPVFSNVILLLVYVPAVVYPQFTLVSGFLAFAAISLLCIPHGKYSIIELVISASLIVLSGLVRLQEMLLVVVISLPLLVGYWRATESMKFRRYWLVAALSVAVVLVGFHVVDQRAYDNAQWRNFDQTNLLRAEFTDFNLSAYYHDNPGALKDTGYTENDLALFQGWFFIDPRVFAPERIARLIHEVPWSQRVETNLKSYKYMRMPFRNYQILCLLLVILLILILHKRRIHLISSILLLAAVMFMLLVIGRPGVTRIYIPVFCALAILGFMQPRTDIRKLKFLYPVASVIGLIAAAMLILHVSNRNRLDKTDSENIQALTCQLPHDKLIVNWGSSYPFEDEFLPFRKLNSNCPLEIYSIGAFALAPFSLDRLHEATDGKDLISALLAGQSFAFIARPAYINDLQEYFAEHYSVQLQVELKSHSKYFSVYTVSRGAGRLNGHI
jgi:hypothetical protein